MARDKAHAAVAIVMAEVRRRVTDMLVDLEQTFIPEMLSSLERPIDGQDAQMIDCKRASVETHERTASGAATLPANISSHLPDAQTYKRIDSRAATLPANISSQHPASHSLTDSASQIPSILVTPSDVIEAAHALISLKQDSRSYHPPQSPSSPRQEPVRRSSAGSMPVFEIPNEVPSQAGEPQPPGVGPTPIPMPGESDRPPSPPVPQAPPKADTVPRQQSKRKSASRASEPTPKKMDGSGWALVPDSNAQKRKRLEDDKNRGDVGDAIIVQGPRKRHAPTRYNG